MPTYGYECLGCHAQFETMQSIKDDPLTTCETCGGALRKRVYPVGIAFKGSGFYVNDYAPKSGKSPVAAPADAKSDTPDATPAAPAGDAKTPDTKAPDTPAPAESKPAAPKPDTPKPAAV